ncbi:ABC transporter substrate-binding protein [Sphaerisporangium siamense]|uniref:ABC-type nitrate/sulfonate/bicarbonate transport system substrate-binding protein n=1 Tax=Sphaerisporangium siamense TaxID=795645 RepID=A0A7W7D701_9ACTN|nr:ABC transporter substrate-binding protein [Sphaerisporangium siamense]MBB4701415.1 ABC-type nitrate/sulfonate/bicarbonate transport system substrate-binding protein [Sphaerisporangium siamense]GII85538.1 ABC transporter substrate-binding protein [Sphaerisporangium siamense]
MRIRHIVLSVLLAGSLAACGRASGSSGADEAVELRYQGSVGAVTPAELAADLGYLGPLKLTWVGNTISGPQDIQSVATDQTDFGGAFNGAVSKLVASGAPIKAVISYYGSDEHTAQNYYVLDGSPIKGPRDLIGKKVGVNTLGAHMEAVLKEYLKRGGLTPAEIKQVELLVVPPVNAEQSLRARQIDVAVLATILRDKALERGGIHPLFKDIDLFGEFNAGSYVFRERFVAEHPAAVRTFVQGVGKAIDWSRDTPRAQVVARLKAIIAKRGRNEDNNTIGYWKSYGVSSKGGRIAEREFQTWIDWLVAEGELKAGQVKPGDAYTNEYNGSAS